MSQWPSPEIRFFQKVEMPTDSDCWLWVGGKKKAGYGQFAVDNVKVIAHRWSYSHFVEPLGVGLEIDHVCKNRSCVNPFHLEAVTLKENRRRRVEAKTHCNNGHEYTDDNTYYWVDGDGYKCRYCITCRSTYKKAN